MAGFEKQEENEENIFWVTMTDLMLGLVMVFIILFVQFILSASSNTLITQQAKQEVVEELKSALKKNDLEVVIDETNGTVKISNLELFKVNSSELSANGKNYLNKFMPIYLNAIFSQEFLVDNLQNIVIQGHTDSQTFKNAKTKADQHLMNMNLSLRRAYTVSEYAMHTKYNQKYGDKIRQLLIVEGRGSSEPILTNGKEDLNKSRRVELRLVLKNNAKAPDFLQILNGGKI